MEYLRELKTAPCFDCGAAYPWYIMDFDHRPDEIKAFDLSEHRGKSFARVKLEASKCDVVCSNCHRARTWQRKDFLKPGRGGIKETAPLEAPSLESVLVFTVT